MFESYSWLLKLLIDRPYLIACGDHKTDPTVKFVRKLPHAEYWKSEHFEYTVQPCTCERSAKTIAQALFHGTEHRHCFMVRSTPSILFSTSL